MDNSQQKATATRTPRAGRDLPAAITTGVVLCGAVIGTVGWWHWGFVLLMALALV
ncbi:MAG: phosphatidate cytidylyltransferase, partial [Cutibacterium avidum]|nr:phosphatidate cytidylyltransferase [Cutibacterium avidum]